MPAPENDAAVIKVVNDQVDIGPAAELARWMEARGRHGVSVFISPLAHLLRPPPSSDAGPPA